MTIEKKIIGAGRPATDITGLRFGLLTALCIIEDKGEGNGPLWLCLCDCGNTITDYASNLRKRRYSCGCERRPYQRPLAQPHLERQVRNRIAAAWRNMVSRCYNQNDHHYKDWGGRGIRVCDEWRNDVGAFIDWALDNGYADKLSIDREDNDGNYEPDNCRWVTNKEQSRNRRSTILTPDEAAEIKRRLDAGEKPSAIARDIGHGDRPHLVYNIKNNGAWGANPKNYYKETKVTVTFNKGDDQ